MFYIYAYLWIPHCVITKDKCIPFTFPNVVLTIDPKFVKPHFGFKIWVLVFFFRRFRIMIIHPICIQTRLIEENRLALTGAYQNAI